MLYALQTGDSWALVPEQPRHLARQLPAAQELLDRLRRVALGVDRDRDDPHASRILERALRAAPSAFIMSGQTSGQVRVDERQVDGLAAQRRELEELAVLVAQHDLRRLLGRPHEQRSGQLAGLQRDRLRCRSRHLCRRPGRDASTVAGRRTVAARGQRERKQRERRDSASTASDHVVRVVETRRTTRPSWIG